MHNLYPLTPSILTADDRAVTPESLSVEVLEELREGLTNPPKPEIEPEFMTPEEAVRLARLAIHSRTPSSDTSPIPSLAVVTEIKGIFKEAEESKLAALHLSKLPEAIKSEGADDKNAYAAQSA